MKSDFKKDKKRWKDFWLVCDVDLSKADKKRVQKEILEEVWLRTEEIISKLEKDNK